MSLTVSNNSNGTITVSCGAESVTVGTPTTTTSASSSGPSKWPHVTPSGGGVTAGLMTSKSGAFTVKNQIVNSVAEITTALKSALPTGTDVSRHNKEAPLILRFGWNSREAIDMKEIADVWRSFGDQPNLDCEIYFSDSDG